MSGLIGAAMPNNIVRGDDVRHVDEFYFGRDDLVQPPAIVVRQWEEEREFRGYTTPWWPRSGGLLGDAGDTNLFTQPAWWGEAWHQGGASGRLAFVGYTRDYAGQPVGNCTVRCFVTSTNELVSSVVSDANGYYIATTPYYANHYLVCHKAGSPEIAGATISTLTPG